MRDEFQLALNVMSFMVSAFAKCSTYTSWSAEFIKKEIDEARVKIKKDVGTIDLQQFSEEQLKQLGCQFWDEDSKVMLLPLWLYDLLPIGLELTCISGETKIVTDNYQDNENGDYIDNDIRFGCISYGVDLEK